MNSVSFSWQAFLINSARLLLPVRRTTVIARTREQTDAVLGEMYRYNVHGQSCARTRAVQHDTDSEATISPTEPRAR